MLTKQQKIEYLARGFSEQNLLEVDEILESGKGKFEFYNMANIGGGEYRLMFREEIGRDAKGEPLTKMQCRIGKLIYN